MQCTASGSEAVGMAASADELERESTRGGADLSGALGSNWTDKLYTIIR